jgi:hypothetical protein
VGGFRGGRDCFGIGVGEGVDGVGGWKRKGGLDDLGQVKNVV